MTSILGRFFASFQGGEGPRIRRRLARWESERAPVELTRISGTGKRQPPMIVSIAQVGENDFTIFCKNGSRLATGEAVELCIYRPNGRTVFRSKVLAGCSMESGQCMKPETNKQLSGYRLAIPNRVKVFNNRKHVRVRLDGKARVEVTLQSRKGAAAMRGILCDLSVGGACVEVDGGAAPTTGAHLILFAELPQSGGALAEQVRVVRVQPYRSGRAKVSLAFDKEVKSLLPFIRDMEATRTRQAKRRSA